MSFAPILAAWGWWISFGVCTPVSAESINEPSVDQIRVGTFNTSLFGKRSGDIARRLSSGNDIEASKIAAIIRPVRPDVILINEIDFASNPSNASRFESQYLQAAELPLLDSTDPVGPPIAYPHQFSAPSNTGRDSQKDLNGNGKLGDPEDAYGFGKYSGQYAFAILSRLPIDKDAIRTFANFRWSQLPGALEPVDPATKRAYYSPDVWSSLRLSSKNHVDVPIVWGQRRLHVLACHPTPPVFDGKEDRNGCRNHDEIVFWKHYLDESSAVEDDDGTRGGLPGWSTDPSNRTTSQSARDPFVILGDLNSDPSGGDSRRQAIAALLADPRTQDVSPNRDGSTDNETSTKTSESRRSTATAQWGRREMRVDYVLPSSNARVINSGIFWPAKDEPGHGWIDASDHRLVWVDLEPEETNETDQTATVVKP